MRSFLIAVFALLFLASAEAALAGKKDPQAVNVTNTVPVTVQNEVRTRAADDPAFQPFQAVKEGFFTDERAVVTFDVPAGKRLVVEFATVDTFVPPAKR